MANFVEGAETLRAMACYLRRTSAAGRLHDANPGEIHKAICLALHEKSKKKREAGSPWEIPQRENGRAWKVPYIGPLTGYLVVPLLVLMGEIGAEYIPVADWNEINVGTSYAKRLAEMGFKSEQQRNALVEFLVKKLGKPRSVVENLLCKAYRTNDAFDFFWRNQVVYELRDGRVIEKNIETGEESSMFSV